MIGRAPPQSDQKLRLGHGATHALQHRCASTLWPPRTWPPPLGFEATILPFAEIPQAFATGLIDALFIPPQTGIDVRA